MSAIYTNIVVIANAEADRVFSRYSVESHPLGGFTHAESVPGTSIRQFRGNFPTRGSAERVLAERRAKFIEAHIQQALSGAAKEKQERQLSFSM